MGYPKAIKTVIVAFFIVICSVFYFIFTYSLFFNETFSVEDLLLVVKVGLAGIFLAFLIGAVFSLWGRLA